MSKQAITTQGGRFPTQVVKRGASASVGWEPDLKAWNSGLILSVKGNWHLELPMSP